MNEDQIIDAAEREMDLYRAEVARITAQRDEYRDNAILHIRERDEARGQLALYGEALREIARRTNGYDPGTNEHAVHQVAVSVLALNGVPDDAEPAS